jgi:hypothetical protein
MLRARFCGLFLLFSSHALALPVLFSGWGAGQFGLVVTTPTVNVSGNITAATSNVQDQVIAVGSGVDLALSSGTITGAIDFADAAGTSTGGSCTANPGGICKVDSASVFTGGTVTGVTLQYTAAVTNAVNEWNNLVAASAWGSATGATAVNLSGAGPFVLCAGSGHAGCTTTNTTTTTRTINGVTQTAYLFDISSTNGAIGGNITIEAANNTMVVLLYNGTNALNLSKTVSLADGITSDQVLLNVTSANGMNNTGAMTFNGNIAIKDTNEILNGATINGRLYLGGVATASLNSSFVLNAPGDLNSPEPGTEMMMGGAMLLLALVAKRRRL